MMKVKVGQLKANLSKYLREVREDGEVFEVCVREKTVAYLSPITSKEPTGTGLATEAIDQLRSHGIRVTPAAKPKGAWVPTSEKPGDGKEIENTIVAMRREKDW